MSLLFDDENRPTCIHASKCIYHIYVVYTDASYLLSESPTLFISEGVLQGKESALPYCGWSKSLLPKENGTLRWYSGVCILQERNSNMTAAPVCQCSKQGFVALFQRDEVRLCQKYIVLVYCIALLL